MEPDAEPASAGVDARDRPDRVAAEQQDAPRERRADAVIALTPRLAGLVTGAGVPAQRVHVIPSGVPDGLFDAPSAPEPLVGLPPPPRAVR